MVNYHYATSINRAIIRKLIIMANNPMVTMMSRAKLNQPRTMAVVPTPLLTLPLPRSWAMVVAATEAVCCQRTDTSTKMELIKMTATAIWETGRDGKGFFSSTSPESSCSSCQPGNVARRRKQKKARMMATMLYGFF